MKTRNNNATKAILLRTQEFVGKLLETVTAATVNNYKSAIRLYFTFLKTDIGVTRNTLVFEHLMEDVVTHFRDWLRKERHNSPSSVNRRLSCIRRWILFVAKKEAKYRTLLSAVKDVEPLKEEARPKELALSKEAIKAIIAAPERVSDTRTAARYTTLLTLGYYTAARVDEAISIRIKDLHLNRKDPYVDLLGKGQKVRAVPLDPDAVRTLKNYFKYRFDKDANPDYYVFGSWTNPMRKISEQGVNQQLKIYAINARKYCHDVPEDLHFHQLRRARATHMVGFVKLPFISEFLGHESVDTTMKYLGITLEMKAEAITGLIPEEFRGEEPKWMKNDGWI